MSLVVLSSSNGPVNDVSLQMEWFYKLRSEISNFSYQVPIDVDDMPCVLTCELHEAVDLDFCKWMDHFLEGKACCRSGLSCSSVRKGATEGQSWRAHYAKVQDLFRKNKSCCAHEVLDESWA